MDIVYICIGWALLAIGLIGCFVPMIPGPPIAYCALLVASAVGDHTAPAWPCLVIAGVITAVVTVIDYVIPSWGAAKFHCSRGGNGVRCGRPVPPRFPDCSLMMWSEWG